MSEGVEVYAVDGSSNEAENQLCQISSYLSNELQRFKAALTKPTKEPRMCGIEAMLKTFMIPEEPFVDVEDMTLGVQPPHDDLNAGHAQA